MRLMIKRQGLFHDIKFDVFDEQGNLKYYVKRQGFSIGHKLYLYDRYENEIGFIREKIFSFPRDFEVVIKGVSKGLIMATDLEADLHRYYMDFNDWKVNGVPSSYYEVHSDEELIICINKEMPWADKYSFDIVNPEDEVIGLMLVIAIRIINYYGDSIKLFFMIISLMLGILPSMLGKLLK